MKSRVSDYASARITLDNAPSASSLIGCCPLEEAIVKGVGLDINFMSAERWALVYPRKQVKQVSQVGHEFERTSTYV